jgi:hypothetical protein
MHLFDPFRSPEGIARHHVAGVGSVGEQADIYGNGILAGKGTAHLGGLIPVDGLAAMGVWK